MTIGRVESIGYDMSLFKARGDAAHRRALRPDPERQRRRASYTAGLLGGQYIGIDAGRLGGRLTSDGDQRRVRAGRDRAREPDQQVPVQSGGASGQAKPRAARDPGVRSDAMMP
ncbi:MAG: hypothetical protein MZV65_25625 [Chromatiales bacterium]|nr:hypothetical protein [Chromatiales bacterium]